MISCSICGRNMQAPNGMSFFGLYMTVSLPTIESQAAWKMIYPELPDEFDVKICYVCWLASLRGTGMPLRLHETPAFGGSEPA